MSEELKPCLMCGNKPEISTFAIPNMAWCANEQCPVGPSFLFVDGLGKTNSKIKSLPINLWNYWNNRKTTITDDMVERGVIAMCGIMDNHMSTMKLELNYPVLVEAALKAALEVE